MFKKDTQINYEPVDLPLEIIESRIFDALNMLIKLNDIYYEKSNNQCFSLED